MSKVKSEKHLLLWPKAKLTGELKKNLHVSCRHLTTSPLTDLPQSVSSQLFAVLQVLNVDSAEIHERLLHIRMSFE